MSEIIKVGMADLNVCISPGGITTLGLGSCVGIALRDPVTGIGGLAHIMLPDSTQIKDNSNIPKFADTGIEELVRRIVAAGGNRSRLVAKIAGGAQMFAFQNKSSMVRVGEKQPFYQNSVLYLLPGSVEYTDPGRRYRTEFW